MSGILALAERVLYRIHSTLLSRRYPPALTAVHCGNYAVIPDALGATSVVYSVGVGKNVSFDEELVRRFSCTVHLFDPTPIAIAFMKALGSRAGLQFLPWGLWTEDGPQAFYFKREHGDERQNLSITNLFDTTRSVTLECVRLPTILARLRHDHVDLLKLDIEGAALPVLRQMLEGTIRPQQIVFELEKGATPARVFFREADALVNDLLHDGYQVHYLPRPDTKRYNLMFLAVRRRLIVDGGRTAAPVNDDSGPE